MSTSGWLYTSLETHRQFQRRPAEQNAHPQQRSGAVRSAGEGIIATEAHQEVIGVGDVMHIPAA
jgi:hypothetical protein